MRTFSLIEPDPSGLVYTPPPASNTALPLPFLVAGRSVLLRPWIAPRVLILGYGLGAMAAVALRARPGAALVGLEPNRERCLEAKQYARRGLEIRCEDAISYLRYTQRRFDLVIDDCFEEPADGDTRRPQALCEHAAIVRQKLAPRGIYVRNLLAGKGHSLAAQWRDVRAFFPWYRLRRFRDWDNALAIASDRPLAPGAWRRLSTG